MPAKQLFRRFTDGCKAKLSLLSRAEEGVQEKGRQLSFS